ncbi:MAG: hypothetical protein HN778_03020 [Prolixibacteraceae bacterium]|jgi:hypothetical protein|nr:hypothetical protein [Prolixibacteraceae bacterium]MBT6007159.1 hypothetical protein [Prolixibacteraceae bacterium]MBT6764555.1 hypothetical protein [Prolixibacteraceae bacterium]MBT6996812.1 hypothetical protein [Prolixibacteraceae bacterium]MBT7393784.1 hypothetical protein [Prolixibacteraceae bacterium]
MAKGKKTGGRELGTPNKLTCEIREVYQKLIENNFSNVENWLKIVSKENPDKALNFIIRLSEFVVPKLQSTTLSNSIDFESLTDVELKSLIERIKNI